MRFPVFWPWFLLVFFFLSSSSLARPAKGPWGGWGPGSRYGAQCTPQSQEQLHGVVEKVERFSSGKGRSTGVRLSFKTETETLTVILGPAWFLEEQKINLQDGDRLTIAGCRVGSTWPAVFVAATVQRDGKIWRLREADGRPLWAAQKWRQRR